ncbi:transglycosylase domain-containing protein [Virgibacillus sp. MSP4-1]|uniref:biosynthetic peptidoglycan transglycosylase n=1 Tax=Virgibacillus sp. MSP4-1 TaxID=2700081 RepID=UPI00039B58AF|nr:biosynthetic peptidoglycan transglycosylase [Virgibacillus sp. MSP4-1]QHS24352.1 transglycosylase domain-containing protein [Virgibacillus sp. MSP4-1]
MIRLIRNLTILALSLVLLVAAIYGVLGYNKYKESINSMPIKEKVESVRQDESFVPLSNISPDFSDAVVAIEDHRFYEHGAFEFISLVRAALTNLIKGEIVQGGSTITQQVAKNLYYSNKQTLVRKVAELFVAIDLEEMYSKDEILELYVNIVYYGESNVGIKEASMHYFDKQPSKLTYKEATFLAGLPRAPSIYSSNSKAAKDRQAEVMEALKDYRNENEIFE